MATNPIGRGTVNVPVNVPTDLANALQELAKNSGIKRNAYMRKVLEDAVARGLIVKIESSLHESAAAVRQLPPEKKANYKLSRKSKGQSDSAQC